MSLLQHQQLQHQHQQQQHQQAVTSDTEQKLERTLTTTATEIDCYVERVAESASLLQPKTPASLRLVAPVSTPEWEGHTRSMPP